MNTFKRKLMFANKSPRRIDRRAGARNKKIILKSYQKIIKGKINKLSINKPMSVSTSIFFLNKL